MKNPERYGWYYGKMVDGYFVDGPFCKNVGEGGVVVVVMEWVSCEFI